MLFNVKNRLLLILAVLFVSGPVPIQADIIYFHDGMRTVCQDKAWEEDGEVKCEYEGVILSYKKADVLRIEKKQTDKQSEIPPAKKQTSVEPEIKTITAKKDAVKTDNLSFYDPRRTLKYWTSESSKHKTLKEAIAALALQYGRSPEWVQAHMGDTNDLAEIHRNLAKSESNGLQGEAGTEPINIPSIEFYNPRRANKYWISETSKYNTLREAIDALARQYDRPAEWIQTYMGKTNDLNEIHRNLRNRKNLESSQQN
jgi:hypothetical protein